MADQVLHQLAIAEQVALALRRTAVPQRGSAAVSVLEDPDSCLAQLNALMQEMPARRCSHMRRRPNQRWFVSLSRPYAQCARCRWHDPIWDPYAHPVGPCDCCGAETQYVAERSSPDNLGTGALWRCLACGDDGYDARRIVQ